MLRPRRGAQRRDLQRLRPARQEVHEASGRQLPALEPRRRRQVRARHQVDRSRQEADEAEGRPRRREQPVRDAGEDQEEARLPPEEQEDAAGR